MNARITVVIPVYGRSELLTKALDSVYGQSYGCWRLLLADDGSDQKTLGVIRKQLKDKRVSTVRSKINTGLFNNLNQSIHEVSTDWMLILCSDDILEVNAIQRLEECLDTFPDCELVLSSFRTICEEGKLRFDTNGYFYDRFAPETTVFEEGGLLVPLLKYGSINGNITGMLIKKSLFDKVGIWRADWSQAADWEWLIRACEKTRVLINRESIARVRVHSGQLSVANRKDCREGIETMQVLGILRKNILLDSYPDKMRFLAHHAQFILWNTIKGSISRSPWTTVKELKYIHKYVGLRVTFASLVWKHW